MRIPFLAIIAVHKYRFIAKNGKRQNYLRLDAVNNFPLNYRFNLIVSFIILFDIKTSN